MIALSKKTFLGLFTAGLLSATVFTSTLITAPMQSAQATQIANLNPSQSLAPLVEKVMPSVSKSNSPMLQQWSMAEIKLAIKFHHNSKIFSSNFRSSKTVALRLLKVAGWRWARVLF
jgi:hypothetical protein